MRIDIQHVEKSKGLVFRKTLHGVALTVQFSGEEEAIIKTRRLGNDVIVERGAPADVDAEKHASRGLMKKIATAAVKGMDGNNFHLTATKLMRGTDTYFFNTPLEAKEYEEHIREVLPNFKEHLLGNAEIANKSDSFEL